MELEEFISKVTKRNKTGHFKVRNSYNIHQIFRYISKKKWYDIGRPVKEHEFYTIVRSVNRLMAENLIHGEEVVLPERMGVLELRKFERVIGFKNGKVTIPYPVLWRDTLCLWYNDKEAYEKQIVIRDESKYNYRIKYDKYHANYNNKRFYKFTAHERVRKALKENIKNGVTDVLW